MSTEYIVSLLIAERAKLEAAIAALQGSASRHESFDYDAPNVPEWVKPAARKTAATPRPAKRKAMSAAGKRAIREGVRKRWAAIRAAKAELEAVAPKPDEVAPKPPRKKKTLGKPRTVSKKLAAAIAPPPEETDFKKRMSEIMKKAWAKRRAAATKTARKKMA
jgi:hypothetical protein